MLLDNELHSRVNPKLGAHTFVSSKRLGAIPLLQESCFWDKLWAPLHTHPPALRSQHHGFRETSKQEMSLHSFSVPLHPS